MEAKEWQKEAIEAWVTEGKRGTIKAPTGSGKSYLAIMAYHRIQNPTSETQVRPNFRMCVIVPTLALKAQWEKDLDNQNIPAVVWVINTVRENPKLLLAYPFIVLDEVHHYAAAQSKVIFNHMQYSYILGLSATPERRDMEHEVFYEHAPIVYTYKMVDAIANDDVADFEIEDIPVHLNTVTESRLRSVDDFIRLGMQRYQNDLSKVTRTLAQPGWQGKKEAGALMRAIQQRKGMLFDCIEKNDSAFHIAIGHRDERVIIFTEVISSAEKIYAKIVATGRLAILYHSKLKKKDKTQAIELFAKYPSAVLVSVKATDEGVNVPSASVGIIVSGTSVDRQFIQRLGRILRPQPGKTALLYHLFVANSKDEKWARQRVRDLKQQMRNN